MHRRFFLLVIGCLAIFAGLGCSEPAEIGFASARAGNHRIDLRFVEESSYIRGPWDIRIYAVEANNETLLATTKLSMDGLTPVADCVDFTEGENGVTEFVLQGVTSRRTHWKVEIVDGDVKVSSFETFGGDADLATEQSDDRSK